MVWIFRGNPKLLPLWALVIGSFNLVGLRNGGSAEVLDAIKVSAVAGGEAILPCDTHSPHAGDALLLIVWYRDDVPVYSYDGRVKGPSSHWEEDTLGGRARWHSGPPSALRIRDIVGTDRALYRCRVDFKVSPTRNIKIILDVVELPERPKILDERGEVNGVAGPYYEDTRTKLSCVVSGGRPMPRLRWWKDDKVIQTLPPLDDGSLLSTLDLTIPKLSRVYLDAIYTCTADNTPLVPPLRVNVQIQLYLRPLLVEILAREHPLSVGREAELSCRAVGARPPAVITWWLNEVQLHTMESQKNSADMNETVSILRWTPKMENDGKILTCRASHEKLPHSTIETTMSLSLHYMPMVVLQLGSKLNPNDIEEGDDVYFECVVRANPPAYKVVWEHNGQVMTHNQRAGVIAGSAHLALQGVSREQAGRYECTASNVEGDGKSAAVNLQVIYVTHLGPLSAATGLPSVLFKMNNWQKANTSVSLAILQDKPVCKNSSPQIVGAAVNEGARVFCEVDAYPPPKNFQWTLNNSMGTVELDSTKFTVDGIGRSILTYAPSSETDYGSLACRATNLAGQQLEPCRYTLLPAVKPEQPINCTTLNLTDDSVELKCFAGYDGGLRTKYVVEAWASGLLVANSSSTLPVWKLRALGAGRALILSFYAYNARGRSESTTLRIHTPSRLALHTEAKSGVKWEYGWAVGGIAGAGGALAALACIAVMARRRQRSDRYQAPHNTKTYKAPTNANHSPLQADDKNPDVIPLGKDFNTSREIDRPPEPPPYGAVVSPPVGTSKSAHSLQHVTDVRPHTPHTPNTPMSDAQSVGTMAEDRRSVTSGTLSRKREVVTTRTPLLANAHRESCV